MSDLLAKIYNSFDPSRPLPARWSALCGLSWGAGRWGYCEWFGEADA